MHPHDDDETQAFHILATRYLSGEATSEERKQLVERLWEPRWNKLFDELRNGWDAVKPPEDEMFDADAAANRLANIIAAEAPPPSSPAETHQTPAERRPAWAWRRQAALLAASLAVAIAGLSVWFKAGRAKTPAPVVWAQQSNPVGERSVVTLGDGTKVTLNAGGILSYPESFGSQGPRRVRLSGEAFFDVAHDQSRPFIVETNTLRITVLGTQFNVRAYSDGLKAQVGIIQGRVQVTRIGTSANETEGNPVILTPGLQYSYIPTTQVGQVKSASAESITGWMNGIIIWDREPVTWAMRTLERRFGISVEIADPDLANETLTGRFETNSVEEIFKTLQLTGALHYRIVYTNEKIDRIVLSKNDASAP